jgi:hypothetical protein
MTKKKENMEIIGQLNDRQIYYISVRTEPNWSDNLPTHNWLVFTIADEPDKNLLFDTIQKCINNHVNYICSTGQLAKLTENLFDEEIVYRAIAKERETGKPYDYEQSPITTMHQNFGEGFWFAVMSAFHEYEPIIKVICLDLTEKGVKNALGKLVKDINNGWLPSDEAMESPSYDL